MFKSKFSAFLISGLLLPLQVVQSETSAAKPTELASYQVDLSDAKLSECLDISDPKLTLIKGALEGRAYAYKDILPAHFEEWKESAVSDEIIRTNVISIPGVVCQKKNLKRLEFFTPIVDFLGWRKEKLPYNPKISSSGWIVRGALPFDFTKDASWSQVKLTPNTLGENFKYAKPGANSPSRQIGISNSFLKVSKTAAQDIFAKAEHTAKAPENFWYEVYNSNMPVHLTEGVKKAGSLLTAGYAGVGLMGVCGGIHTMDEEGNQIAPEIHDQIAPLLNTKRTIYLVYDLDQSAQIIEFVRNAEAIFGDLLAEGGADVRIVSLPGPEKGVDDFIAARGAEAYDELVAEAKPLAQWKKDTDIHGDLKLIVQFLACRV